MIGRLQKIILVLDDVLASVLLAALTLLTVANVFMRYIVHQPFQWAGEVTILLFIWTIMFGAASVMKREGHIGIDVFITPLPKGVQRVMRIIADVIIAVILIVLIYFGSQLTLVGWNDVMPITGLKLGYETIAVPIGSAWILLHALRNLWKEITLQL